ncbi:hypothetical protein TRIATDRAFT_94099 [Trichoderma atroviride IMI 206040]|uniref:Uncharacterized protein n=1 Tax=Hypocrea atroviridis (strain ATCC 20476 / IMI 206040) TaxID=452589 RepID=G9NEH5_HYPAI|nr:uncharacterized protein TRIATDRAFT_94099 [Trichoderma atroviride IMI 206040]EHK50873.1 hypothetical protein TRIATDRAFT_94099 [Trichoderma atroviride IMI 206040]
MHLKHLLAAVQIGLAVALPAPDLNTVDVNPTNGTVTDMSRYIPCDKKTIKKYCNKTCPAWCSVASPKCWSCVAVCAQAQYYWDVHCNDKLGKCARKGEKCKEDMKECTYGKIEDCSKKYAKCIQQGELCQGQLNTLQEMGKGVVVSEGTEFGKKRVVCRIL